MIKVVDLLEMAQNAPELQTENERGVMRKVLMDGPRFHSWLHVYEPGHHDDMHCHNADQTFTCLGGECTMYFEDGSTHVLKPGMVALIPGGSFYWLHNRGLDRMILLGTRALSNAASQKIDYVTRQNVHHVDEPVPPGTRIMV